MYSFFYNIIADIEAVKGALISLDFNKLDAFGEEYVFEAIKAYSKAEAYKVYVTDTLRLICENTAKFAGGMAPTIRYKDLITPPEPEVKKSAEDIIAEVNKNAGLTMFEEEGEP